MWLLDVGVVVVGVMVSEEWWSKVEGEGVVGWLVEFFLCSFCWSLKNW